MSSISVVIPCYNAAHFVGDAIESALRQSRPVAEVIAVDDRSTDATAAVVRSFVERGHPVRCITAEVNGGPGAARNIGVAAARSPLIAFLDADDWWEADHCAEVAGLLDRFPDAVLGFSACRGDKHHLPPPAASLPIGRPVAASWGLLEDNMVPQSTAVVRRDAFLAAGGYRPEMRHSEDFDLWTRLAAVGHFVASSRCTCVRRVHDEQASRNQIAMLQAGWLVRRGARARIAGSGDPHALRRADAILRTAYERSLATTWPLRDRDMMFQALDLAPVEVDGIGEVVESWRRRMRYVWPMWRMGAAVWDRVPPRLQQRIRRMRETGQRSQAEQRC